MIEMVRDELNSHYATSSAAVRVVRHKKDVFEVGGDRFCYQQCHSDRPGFEIIMYENERPIVHVYLAMGLEHQHELQEVVLARCTSYVVAAFWVRACMELYGHKVDHYLLGDCEDGLRTRWRNGCERAGLLRDVYFKGWRKIKYTVWRDEADRNYRNQTSWDSGTLRFGRNRG